MIVERNGKVVGSVEMPCCPSYVCKLEVKCYRGDKRDDSSEFATISKCACNCHMMYGKACGCCFGPAQTMVFNVTPSGPGYLDKEHFGLVNECCNMADKYNLDYPTNDADEQAVYLAAVHFIDLLYFENNYYGQGGI